MSDVQDLIRAIALDRAYQIAGSTCRWCGLPAVRSFAPGFVGQEACTSCVPPPPRPKERDLVVEKPEDLTEIGAKTTERFTDVRVWPYVFVRSVERFFELVEIRFLTEAAEKPDGVERFASFDPNKLWCRREDPRDVRPADLPNRKAVERLLRIAKAEP